MSLSSTAALSAVNQLSALLEMMRDPKKAQETIDAIKAATEKHEASLAAAKAAMKLQLDAGDRLNERAAQIELAHNELTTKTAEHEAKVKEFNESSAATVNDQMQKKGELQVRENDLSAQRDSLTIAKRDFDQRRLNQTAALEQREAAVKKRAADLDEREKAIEAGETKLRTARENIAREAAHI